jgi:hypothetical protein
MPDRPVLLLPAAGVTPRRADTSPEADWRMAVLALSWAEGHGQCGGLQACPDDTLVCPCGRLRFEVGAPVLAAEAVA